MLTNMLVTCVFSAPKTCSRECGHGHLLPLCNIIFHIVLCTTILRQNISRYDLSFITILLALLNYRCLCTKFMSTF